MLDWCSAQDWWKLATNSEPGQYAPRRRNNLGNAHHVNLVERKQMSRYSLKNLDPNESHFTPEQTKHLQQELKRIQAELQCLWRFQTSIQVKQRQDQPIRKPTAEKMQTQIYLILGWLHYYEQEPIENLGLERLDDIDIAYNYTDWFREERKGSPKTEIQALTALLHVAKFLHHQESDQANCEAHGKKYIDIMIISEIRKLIRDTNKRVKDAPITASDESKKWLDWPEYLACVEYLKKDCALLTSDGAPRTDRAIACSHQRYLIAALLAYMPPDRQRTFRELEEGKTLVRGVVRGGIFYAQQDGYFYIKLLPDQYKTGDAYGKQILKVPEFLYSELEEWLNKWRPLLNPTHSFIFTKLNGKPLTEGSLYHLFRHAIYRASVVLFGEGKATNPHLVRDMLVTYCYQIGASEIELDGLALGMKHSRKTQREQYDRRTNEDKIEPALELMQRLQPVELPLPQLKIVDLNPR
jgi:integrase